MQKKLILLLVFMVLIAVLALQNSVEVEIKLWFWKVKTSMVLILILTFAAGAIAGILFSIPKRSKNPEKIHSESTGQPSGQESSEKHGARKMDEFEDLRP